MLRHPAVAFRAIRRNLALRRDEATLSGLAGRDRDWSQAKALRLLAPWPTMSLKTE
jgi:hypothetical protein